MTKAPALRFLAIILGTVLWDVGAVLQKKAVEGLPPTRLRVVSLMTSGRWMAGLLVTALGWGLYVFGLDRVPVSAARTITGGSYVVLALFSIIFLRTPLRLPEWIAVVLVTSGIPPAGPWRPPGSRRGSPFIAEGDPRGMLRRALLHCAFLFREAEAPARDVGPDPHGHLCRCSPGFSPAWGT